MATFTTSKHVIYEPKKSVDYLHNIFLVPLWSNYVAADKTGRVFAYEERPYIKKMYRLGYMYKRGTRCEHVGNLSCGRTFTNSIMEL